MTDLLDHERRISRVEIRQDHQGDLLENMSTKVDELHRIMTEAKGAKWAIMTTVGILSFIGGTVATIATWFGYGRT